MTEPTWADWREMAAQKLDDQIQRAMIYQMYYDGEPDVLAILEPGERQTFRKFLTESHANWCEIVVNAVAERLQVDGFRFNGASDTAWSIWQASSMDADAELAQTDGLVTGSGYALVQPDEDNPTGVSISVESPLEAVVLYEPGNRRRRVAGFKRWGENGDQWQVLILPDRIATWEPGEISLAPRVTENPAGVVGLIEIPPQPRTLGPPRSELASAIPFQDRINTTIFNRLVATDYGAFRQIWATGVKLRKELYKTKDGESERYVKPFDIGANRLLTNENPDGRFGSFPESTLGGYLNAIEQDVNQLAAVTQTPPHYLIGQMVNLSADAIKAAEAGLIAKVRRRSRHIGEAWEEVMRVALGLIGDPGAVDVAGETEWRDFETRSEAQLADALGKMANIGVPPEVLWRRWGASERQVSEWKRINAENAATMAANQAAALGATEAYSQLLAGGGGEQTTG